MLESLFYSIVHRPYVFVFLLTYGTVGVCTIGGRRTVLFTCWAAGIAWVSEFASINTGFPYGWYEYHYDVLRHDLLIGGVPFFDSISYSFLTFCGWMTALLVLVPDRFQEHDFQFRPGVHHLNWTGVVLGAFLTMLLDVIIDPVAHLGRYWFLGDIYSYPDGGMYFDVPLSNFGGWFLTSLVILGGWKLLDDHLLTGTWNARPATDQAVWSAFWGPALYFGVILFNTVIACWIGALWIGLVNSLLFLCLFLLVVLRVRGVTSGRHP